MQQEIEMLERAKQLLELDQKLKLEKKNLIKEATMFDLNQKSKQIENEKQLQQ